MIRGLLSTLLAFAAAIAGGVAHAQPCSPGRVMAGGAPLWVDLEGRGKLTIVFEAGNGNDSSVWTDIVTRVRALGMRMIRASSSSVLSQVSKSPASDATVKAAVA